MSKNSSWVLIAIILLFILQLLCFYLIFRKPRYELSEFNFDKIPLLVKFDNHTGEIHYRSITSFSDDAWEIIDEESNFKITAENVRHFKINILESSFIEGTGYDYGNAPYFKLSLSNNLDFDVRNLFFRAVFSSEEKVIETVSVKNVKILIPNYLHILEFRGIYLPFKRKVNLDIYISNTQEGPWFKINFEPITLESKSENNIVAPHKKIIWD